MAIAQLFPLFMILSFVYTCAMIVKSVVHEKERRLKETMRTMGLGNAVHWVAWMIDSMSFMFIACILLSIILVVSLSLRSNCLFYSINSNFRVLLLFTVWKSFGKFELPFGVHIRFQFQPRNHLLQFSYLNLLQPGQPRCCVRWIHIFCLFFTVQLFKFG